MVEIRILIAVPDNIDAILFADVTGTFPDRDILPSAIFLDTAQAAVTQSGYCFDLHC